MNLILEFRISDQITHVLLENLHNKLIFYY
jgi:hypothetical protein